jgi:hypothetical protein
VGEFKQAENLNRLVPVLVSDDDNASGLAAGVDFDPDTLNLAPDPVLQANRERVTAMHNRMAAREKRVSPLLRARHHRPLTLIENEYRQLCLRNFALRAQ